MILYLRLGLRKLRLFKGSIEICYPVVVVLETVGNGHMRMIVWMMMMMI